MSAPINVRDLLARREQVVRTRRNIIPTGPNRAHMQRKRGRLTEEIQRIDEQLRAAVRTHAVMRQRIDSVEDVRAWLRALLDAGVNYHPDETLAGIVDINGEPTWTEEEAAHLDRLMARSWEITRGNGLDLNGVALDVLRQFDPEMFAAAPVEAPRNVLEAARDICAVASEVVQDDEFCAWAASIRQQLADVLGPDDGYTEDVARARARGEQWS